MHCFCFLFELAVTMGNPKLFCDALHFETKIQPTLNHTKNLEICGNVSDSSNRNTKRRLADEISVSVFDNAASMISF